MLNSFSAIASYFVVRMIFLYISQIWYYKGIDLSKYMKWNWITRKVLITFFLCEMLVFTGIQTFNFALRMDIVVSRVEMGIFYLLLPILTPLLLLIIKNSEKLPPLIEKIAHFLSGGFYFLLFIIFQVNSWQTYIFSMNFSSVIWFCTVGISTVSIIFSLGNPNTPTLFLTRDHFAIKNKKLLFEFLLSFLILLACLALVPLLKYAVFYWAIAGFIHLVYGAFLMITPQKISEKNPDLIESNLYSINEIWRNDLPNSKKKSKLSRALDKIFLIFLYLASWFVWADFVNPVMHPEIYFNIYYILFYTPIMYLGWWLYRFEGKNRRTSFYLSKHLIIILLLLLHFVNFNFFAPFVMGYSIGALTTAIRQKNFRKRVVVSLLLQFFLIAGFGLMLTKWIAPFLYSIGIMTTYVLILISTASLIALVITFLSQNYTKNKNEGKIQ